MYGGHEAPPGFRYCDGPSVDIEALRDFDESIALQMRRIPSPSVQPSSIHHEETEVKYVLAGQPTGWAAMAKEVRDLDEEKVQSCKDDVDTLLVFAGLFSAILSAFLVAAYPNLQQSPLDRVAYALEQIAVQTAGYNLTDGILISANALPVSPPPFQASNGDIRVNILWFASLVVSLVTASFGMLVKQWLREFLAVEVPSPQARLRLRHFREPQLRKWKVYEIVACLPLLLQLSLGLFFVGLCYFSSSIHESVGNTVLPLVVGWSFCFFGSSVLPVFFPRCPYRTTLLKTGVAHLHRTLSRVAGRMSLKTNSTRPATSRQAEDNSPKTLTWTSWKRSLLVVCKAMRSGIHNARSQLLTFTSACRRVLPVIQKIVLRAVTRQRKSFLEVFSRKALSAGFSRLRNTCILALRGIPDERAVVEDSSVDIDILASVDVIQANDELLATAIVEAVSGIYPKPPLESIAPFILQVLSHRLQTERDSERVWTYWPFESWAPLGSLQPGARDAILSIFHRHLVWTRKTRSHRPEHQNWYAESKGGKLETNIDPTILLTFLIVISEAVANIDIGEILPRNAVSLLRYYLKNNKSGAALCRAMVIIIIPIPKRNNIDDKTADLLGGLAKLAELLKIGCYTGTVIFRAIQEHAAAARGCDYPLTRNVDWGWDDPERWWPGPNTAVARRIMVSRLDQQTAHYLDAIMSVELQHVSWTDLYKKVPESRAFSSALWSSCLLLYKVVPPESDALSDRQDSSPPAAFRRLVQMRLDVVSFAISSSHTTDLLIDALTSEDSYKGMSHQGLPFIKWARIEPTRAVTDEHYGVISSVIARKLSEAGNNLAKLLRICDTALFLTVILDGRSIAPDKCYALFKNIASHLPRPEDHFALPARFRSYPKYSEVIAPKANSAYWALRCECACGRDIPMHPETKDWEKCFAKLVDAGVYPAEFSERLTALWRTFPSSSFLPRFRFEWETSEPSTDDSRPSTAPSEHASTSDTGEETQSEGHSRHDYALDNPEDNDFRDNSQELEALPELPVPVTSDLADRVATDEIV